MTEARNAVGATAAGIADDVCPVPIIECMLACSAVVLAAQSPNTGAVLAAGTAEVAVLAASTNGSMATVLPYEEAIGCVSCPTWGHALGSQLPALV